MTLYGLSGLPLAIPCCLLRWMGHPVAAWVMLVLVPALALVAFPLFALLLTVPYGLKRGYEGLVQASVIFGITATVFSLFVWITCWLAYLGRDRKPGAGGGAPPKPGTPGSC